jgi:hypothetical protein
MELLVSALSCSGHPFQRGERELPQPFPVQDLAHVQVWRFVGAGVQAEAAAVFHQSVGVQGQG